MVRVKGNYLLALAMVVLSGLCLDANAQSTTTFPPIIVTAPRQGGGMVECMSIACSNAVNETSAQMLQEYLAAYARYPDEDLPLDPAKFCAKLKAKQPQNCSLNSPPSTPRWDSGWQPNGCGDGSVGSDIANAIIGSGYPITGGTGLDQPAADVYFKPACDAHDRCYGMVFGRASCDNEFLAGMSNICISSSNTACGSIASAYYQAANIAGGNAYDAANQKNTCAAWSADMKANGCQ